MTTPREIIAYQIPGTSAELCFGLTDSILEALTASGYHILSDADLAARDDAVLERAATQAELLHALGYSGNIAFAIRARKGSRDG